MYGHPPDVGDFDFNFEAWWFLNSLFKLASQVLQRLGFTVFKEPLTFNKACWQTLEWVTCAADYYEYT